MEERLKILIERFPQRADVIRALNETSARFKDLIGDHYEVSTELSRMTMPDQESQAWKKDELERRRDNIEEELRLLMQDQQRP